MKFDDEITQLTTSIWDSMLRLPIEPAEPAALSETRTMCATVHITGPWPGAVALSCGVEMANQAAGIMFNLGNAAPTISDLQDALGELANMIGGNIKALLPDGCHLSLPSVVEGSNYSVRIPGSRLVTSVPFRCGDHAISVSLLEREAKAA